MATEKKKGRGGFFIWGGLGVLVLMGGVVLAVYFIQQSNFPPNHRLRIVQDFVGRFTAKIEEGSAFIPSISGIKESVSSLTEKIGPLRDRFLSGDSDLDEDLPARLSGTRTHTVLEGENLWKIAGQGTLVEHPWQWSTILNQNRDKVDYAFVSAGQGGWKVLVATGKQLVVRDEAPLRSGGGDKWALQMMSLEEHQLDLAIDVVSRLLKGGHFAYFYRTEVNGKVRFRVRAGFFDSSAEAKSLGRAIKDQYPDKELFGSEFWIMQPTDEELDGDLFDFGAQNVNPYIIDFSAHPTHGEALVDFKQLAGGDHFAYIAQQRNAETNYYSYRTRIGFFATEAAAQAVVDQGLATGEEVWSTSHVITVSNFTEAAPGQPMRLSKPDL